MCLSVLDILFDTLLRHLFATFFAIYETLL